MSGTTPVDANFAERAIRQAIADRGPITFAEFMQFALYSQGGYYTSGSPISASGDFFTSPSAHPLFGALVTVQLREMWQKLDSPERLTVIEEGAGNGGLAADIVEFAPLLDPAFATALDYLAFDTAPPKRQHYPVSPPGELPSQITGCVLSNELLDAIPFHRFEIRDGIPLEIHIGLEDDELTEILLPPRVPLIEQRLLPFAKCLPEAYRGEINAGLDSWSERQAQTLERGWVLTIDYGCDRATLYRPERMTGSLRCYFQQMLRQDPLRNVGRQDITAHVDFTAVDEAMRAAGFSSAGSTTQEQFLKRLGFGAAIEQLHAAALPRPALRANEAGMRSLVDTEGMGGFVVTAHSRNVPEVTLGGFSMDDAIHNIPVPPLLSQGRHINLTGAQQSQHSYFEVQSLDELFTDAP